MIKRCIVKSYTLIELLIAVAIISFTIPTLFGLLFFSFRIQLKNKLINQVKREGDYAISAIAHTIRNSARGLTLPCSSAIQTDMLSEGHKFIDKLNSSVTFTFYDRNEGGYHSIASSSSSLGDILLTSNQTTISDFALLCQSSSLNSSTVITIKYKIYSRIDESVLLSYQNKIVLRN